MQMPDTYKTAETKQGGVFEDSPTIGAYILKLISVEEKKSGQKDMAVFHFDIGEDIKGDGKAVGFYQRKFDNDTRPNKKWGLSLYQTITSENVGYYKGILKSFAESNTMHFPIEEFKKKNHNLSLLVGFSVGSILRMEEYQKDDGSIGEILKIFFICSTQTAFAKKDFIPKPKKIKQDNSQQQQIAQSGKDPGAYDPELGF